jgi:hypothetical protein
LRRPYGSFSQSIKIYDHCRFFNQGVFGDLRCVLGGRQRPNGRLFSIAIEIAIAIEIEIYHAGVWNSIHLVGSAHPTMGNSFHLVGDAHPTMGHMRKPSRSHLPGRVVGWALPTTTPNRRDARRTSPTTGGVNSSSRDLEQVLVIPIALGSDPAGGAHGAGAVRGRGRFANRPYNVHPEGEKGMEPLGIDSAIPMPKRHAIAPAPPL